MFLHTWLQLRPNFADAWSNLASAYMRKGRLNEASQCCRQALALNPHLVDAHSNLGNLMKAQGLVQEEEFIVSMYMFVYCASLSFPGKVTDHYNSCVELCLNSQFDTDIKLLPTGQGSDDGIQLLPEASTDTTNFAIAWSNLAGRVSIVVPFALTICVNCCHCAQLFLYCGNIESNTVYSHHEAVKLKPKFPDAYLNLGNVYKALRMPQEAIVCYQQAVQARPNYAMAFGNLASTYYERGNWIWQFFIISKPLLGNALKDVGRVDEAIQCYNVAMPFTTTKPPASTTNLGNIYMEWNMSAAAASCYKATLAVTTGLSAPFSNLAVIYKQQGNYSDAISCYNEVLRIEPLAADGLVNRGNTYKEIGRVSEAIQDYINAITIRPNMAEAHANLASAYKDSGHVEAAIKSYRQALLLRTDFPEATCNLLHTLQLISANQLDIEAFCILVSAAGRIVIKCSMKLKGLLEDRFRWRVLPSVQPFHAIAYPIDPVLALEISRKYAAHCSIIASRFAPPPFKHPAPLPVKHERGSGRLRIGYVSSDFGNHPLSHLMGSVFGMHNRENVEVFCYALSPNDGTEWRQRTQFEAEHFIDVSAMTSDMIAKLINEDKIQILINLNGYTKGARNEIFAMQPAPIQVSYMGFPGTTGATYIDYLVTDEFVSPTRFSHIYSEKLVHLPHCYFVNDYKQKNLDVLDPTCQHKRSDYGLPEDKFIFACFNQLYKMDPEIFNTWCNILKRVPNSALWLLRFPAAGEMRLRAYAVAQGVQPDQIIFTDVAMKQEHIRRSALADLFLDTPLCNAHTTGTDILWAGLPMVTMPLEKMATRVAGSLCLATGLGDEMIVSSMKEYEERAVSLALNRPKLQSLTDRLKAARMTCPLFDTRRWVRNLDRAYFKMWSIHCSGQQPHHFKVAENDFDFP
ncbi:hypothetical protein POTOM_061393 [Populus tomentosa]|uniref:protein O-GlcNAc transferase n=1 Tax=Populus tomentosa TaxID=118781 RepID=A0A8X8BZR4_POPTO|nr:hypothetical protein POTOM_061393 [Populus tomentosa]